MERQERQNRLCVFIHVCAKNNYKEMFRKLINCIKNVNGFYDKIYRIYITLLASDLSSVDYSLFDDPKMDIVFNSTDVSLYERPMLNFMYNMCLDPLNDYTCLYIHTKGLRFGGACPCVNDWIDFLIYYNIINYEYCIQAIKDYDAVGVNFRTNPLPHYSGNFFWTKSSHVKTLDYIPHDKKYLSCEMWLCNTKGTYLSIYESDVNHYKEQFPLSNYENKTNEHIFHVECKLPPPTTGIYAGLC